GTSVCGYECWVVMVLCLSAAGPVFVTASFPVTRSALNDPADLYCNDSCPGVTQWRRKDEKVAECGPGAKPGLRFRCAVTDGKSVLTVPQVNHSTNGFYSAYCDGKEMTDSRQLLHLLPIMSEFEPAAGGHLEVDLHVTEPVIILMTRPEGPPPVQLCSVDGRQHQCLPEYQRRVLIVNNSFVLMDVTPADRGIYTVQEKDNTAISVSHVTVRGEYSFTRSPVYQHSVQAPGVLWLSQSDFRTESVLNWEKTASISNPPPPETQNRHLRHVFISTVNGTLWFCYLERASVTLHLELGRRQVVFIISLRVLLNLFCLSSDLQDSGIWRSGYERGNSEGYQRGMWIGAVGVGIAGLVLVSGVFVAGVFAAPRVPPLMDRCVHRLGLGDSSCSDQPEDGETGLPLTSDGSNRSSGA
ncbi:hypothetical protein NFI96_011803, partial [Prochilodus magdalenae]